MNCVKASKKPRKFDRTNFSAQYERKIDLIFHSPGGLAEVFGSLSQFTKFVR